MTTTAETIEQIVAAARRLPTQIVLRRVLRYVPGHPKAGEVCNGVMPGDGPNCYESAETYYVAMNTNGTTGGKRYETEADARSYYDGLQAKNDATFRAELEKMSDKRLQAQADYWLKN